MGNIRQIKPPRSQSLFRPEVTAAQSQQWLGAIRLAQPISGWLIAGVATLIAVALIAFFSLGSVTKKARVTGITIPIGGSISIAAPNAGLLVKTYVSEGDPLLLAKPYLNSPMNDRVIKERLLHLSHNS